MSERASEDLRIDDVHVFTGHAFTKLRAVYISNGSIVSTLPPASRPTVVDGERGYLIPGLIDAHNHIGDLFDLSAYRKRGITTALDMACSPLSKLDDLRNHEHGPNIFSAGIPATVPESKHSTNVGIPRSQLLDGPEDAAQFVVKRVGDGSDYIKIVADMPIGPDQATMNAVTAEARRYGKLVIAHAARLETFRMAQKAGVDVVTHLPIDWTLQDEDVFDMVQRGRISVPTLGMMKGMSEALSTRGQPLEYKFALESFSKLHKAGVPIVAGTDGNSGPLKFSPEHGESLFEELELLVKAGMSNGEALRAATSEAAQAFRFSDRGRLEPGMRADVVLLSEDPLENIEAIRSIRRSWYCGRETQLPGIRNRSL